MQIRKIVRYTDETLVEGGKEAERPWVMAAVAAVIPNPWAGRGFVEDLRTDILEIAPPLGEVLVSRLMATIGGANIVEAYGKAAVVGVNGEVTVIYFHRQSAVTIPKMITAAEIIRLV